MSVYPTRTAAHLTIAGLAIVAAGIALREPAVVAWGGAVVVAVAFARAVTLVSVMRIRAAGFEMLWTGTRRVARVRCGGTVRLDAEVRNRDTLAARYDKLRVVSAPALAATVEPVAGEVHATGSVRLKLGLQALRVGYHGVHGLALEVRGAPSVFEVPLTFANPFGVEVLPRALGLSLATPEGGRARTLALAGRSGAQRGDGTDLRELREHQPGDPFRRIAWKASAKRGVLVVKEFEREERDVVVLVLDASVELWSGPVGGAPLDRAIDQVAALAARHLNEGDVVGLRIVGARELGRLDPGSGRSQAARIAGALMEATGVLDADRSGWDEHDLAVQVAEHLRPFDPRAADDLRGGQLDKLARRAAQMRSHAPFERAAPRGRSTRDARLRRYAACFGMHMPARLEPDRPHSTLALCAVLEQIATDKSPRASLVHVVAPPPPDEQLEHVRVAVRRLRARRVVLRWSMPPLCDGTREAADEARAAAKTDAARALADVVERAVAARVQVATRRGEQALRRAGVRIVRVAGRATRARVHDATTPDP
jgi:uncharacterized protein (DUF58 family)